MKLKKIASLALAGIMAVSMLAGCNGGSSSSEPTNPIEPVDDSFAAAVNAELSDEYKAILTFGSDSALANAVNQVAASTEFNLSLVSTNVWGMDDANVAKTFRELLKVDTNNKFDSGVFTNVTDEKTVASLIVMNGALTEDGLAKAVADELEKYDNSDYFPTGYTVASARYRCEYSGDIAVTKVTLANGTASYYVVGFTMTMNPVEIAA